MNGTSFSLSGVGFDIDGRTLLHPLTLDVPKGEVYQSVEGGNGELGFYLVSDGGRTPARMHIRRPCFIYYQAYGEMIRGAMLSDAIIVLSSMNVIAGELDA